MRERHGQPPQQAKSPWSEMNNILQRCALVAQSCQVVTPWTVAHQTPLSMGILQASILEWVAMPSSRGSFKPRGQTQVSCILGRFLTT